MQKSTSRVCRKFKLKQTSPDMAAMAVCEPKPETTISVYSAQPGELLNQKTEIFFSNAITPRSQVTFSRSKVYSKKYSNHYYSCEFRRHFHTVAHHFLHQHRSPRTFRIPPPDCIDIPQKDYSSVSKTREFKRSQFEMCG